ncbi:MAG: NnrU family protein [Azospirillaceae bacterium]
MASFTLACLALVASHAIPSTPPVRRRLIARFGRRTFMLAYSLLSLAVLAWLLVAWRQAAGGAWAWTPPGWTRWITVLAMPLALWAVAAALMARPAPRIGRAALAGAGVAGWAGLHLLSVGSLRALVLFAALAAIGAIAASKAVLAPPPPGMNGAPGVRRLALPGAVALAAWLALLALHPPVIGIDPLAATGLSVADILSSMTGGWP